jgi:mannitol operon transcriptional antiterminator
MTALDSRSKTILLVLLKSTGPVSAAFIAEQMNTTPRITRSSLQRIESWLAKKDLSVKKQPGKGLSIDISLEEKQRLIPEVESITSYNLILSREERVRLLIIALLTAEEPLLVKRFAPRLGVSRPTLFNDMIDVETWLVDHELKLIRRRGFGFKVDGSELKIRIALETIIFDTNGQMVMLASMQGKSLTESIFQNQLMLQTSQISKICALKLEFERFKCLVEKLEDLSSFKFTDSSYLAMVLFFCILIERTTAGKYITEFPFPKPDLLETKEYSIAQELTLVINQMYGLHLNGNETANIAAHIMGIKGRQSLGGTTPKANSIMKEEDIEMLLDDMIHDAAKLLHPVLNVDQQLRQGLRFHLRPAINRLYFGLPIQNPLLEEIKNQYAYIYWVAEKSGKIIEDWLELEVPETEIGYLAMHFGAAMERLRSLSTNRVKVLIVCGGGCSTAWMLVSRLAAEFPELDVVDIKSVTDLAAKGSKPEGITLIITTIPLEYPTVPIIQVNPLLSAEDKLLIRKVLGTEALKPQLAESLKKVEGPSLTTLLSRETVQFGSDAENWITAVDSSCKVLVQNGSIGEPYVEAIKDLLRQHGPYMVLTSGVVLLHAMTGFGVNRVCMSMTTFQNPIIFGHAYNDPVNLALVIGSPDSHSHIRALRQLSKLLEDKPLMQSLQSAHSEADLYGLVELEIKPKIERMEET